MAHTITALRRLDTVWIHCMNLRLLQLLLRPTFKAMVAVSGETLHVANVFLCASAEL